jgi:hypothetical protein
MRIEHRKTGDFQGSSNESSVCLGKMAPPQQKVMGVGIWTNLPAMRSGIGRVH